MAIECSSAFDVKARHELIVVQIMIFLGWLEMAASVKLLDSVKTSEAKKREGSCVCHLYQSI